MTSPAGKSWNHPRWLACIGIALAQLACGAGDSAHSDCEDCERRALYLFDQLDFIIDEGAGLDGFDLDDRGEDCGATDATAPDGATGIDNQFGSVWNLLPDTVSTVLPTAIDGSLKSGYLMVVMELVGRRNLGADGRAELLLRAGSGDLLVDPTGRPLSNQTVALAEGDNFLGATKKAEVRDGELHAQDLTLLLRVQHINAQVELVVVRGKAHMTDDGAGGLDMKLGGVVPVDAVMDIVTSLGGDGDANLRAALEQLVPLFVDVRTDSNGDCDGISGAFRGHAVPVHLFDD